MIGLERQKRHKIMHRKDLRVLSCEFRVSRGDIQATGGDIKPTKGETKRHSDDTTGHGSDTETTRSDRRRQKLVPTGRAGHKMWTWVRRLGP